MSAVAVRPRKQDKLADAWHRLSIDPNDRFAIEAVVRYSRPLVRRIAMSLYRRMRGNIEFDDLVSSGSIGLMKAIRKFDASREVNFSTFAARRIAGAMLDEVRASSVTSRQVLSRLRVFCEAERGLTARLGRRPTSADIATDLKVDERTVVHAEVAAPKLVSCFSIVDSHGDELPLIELLADRREELPHERLASEEAFASVCRGLSDRERAAMRLRYYHDLPLKTIGIHFGLSESRVSQMFADLHQRLRERFAELSASALATTCDRPFDSCLTGLASHTAPKRGNAMTETIASITSHEPAAESKDEESELSMPANPELIDRPSTDLPAAVVERLTLAWTLVGVAGGIDSARSAIDAVGRLLELKA